MLILHVHGCHDILATIYTVYDLPSFDEKSIRVLLYNDLVNFVFLIAFQFPLCLKKMAFKKNFSCKFLALLKCLVAMQHV